MNSEFYRMEVLIVNLENKLAKLIVRLARLEEIIFGDEK
jgi:hypothetical protein